MRYCDPLPPLPKNDFRSFDNVPLRALDPSECNPDAPSIPAILPKKPFNPPPPAPEVPCSLSTAFVAFCIPRDTRADRSFASLPELLVITPIINPANLSSVLS